jgi:nucleoside phosphorylase
MLVGIAGATPSREFTLGDVVLATELHDFSVRAAVFGKGTEYRGGGGAMAPEVEDFIGLLAGRAHGDWNEVQAIGRRSPPVDVDAPDATYGDPDWQRKVRSAMSHHFPTPRSVRKPQMTTRPFAGGNLLVKDDALWREWQSHARQIEAVEMELGGMYEATRTRNRVYPILVCKGISDVVGFRRDDDWTSYACETAAAGAMALLALGPVDARPKPDLAPLRGLATAELAVVQQARYPFATVHMRIQNTLDRPVRVTGVKIETQQHVQIYDKVATSIDNIPDYERLHQIETEPGKALTVPVDCLIQARLDAGLHVALCNRTVYRELGLFFGVSLYRATVSLILDDELILGVGAIVVDLYAGNPHGMVSRINQEDWRTYNRNVDREMLRDCLRGRYIIDDSTTNAIREFLSRTGDLV